MIHRSLLFSISTICAVCLPISSNLNEEIQEEIDCVKPRVQVVGVEGSSHHGLEVLLPELKKLVTKETDPHCLRVDWTSYPTKGRGMNEAARLSLIYGDSCEWHATSVWKHNNCATQGKWRCGSVSDPMPLHRELVWRFSTFAGLERFNSKAKVLVLRRSLVRSTFSHSHDTVNPWDGSFEAHAVVLASFTSILRFDRTRLAASNCAVAAFFH